MSAIELLGVDAVELAHAARERRVNRLDEEVVGGWQRCALLGANCVRLIVRGVGVAEPVEPLHGLRQNLKEQLSIGIDEEDLATGIAAAGDMVQRRTWSWHRRPMSESQLTLGEAGERVAFLRDVVRKAQERDHAEPGLDVVRRAARQGEVGP